MDCDIWLEFLRGPLSSVVNRKMIDILCPAASSSTDVGFYSDASASESFGFSAILGTKWLRDDWTCQFIKCAKPSIEYLKLFALCAGVITWAEHLADQNICIHCDNIAVVHMINKMTSSCKNCMLLIRLLTLNNLKFNQKLTAIYVSTHSNDLADKLSRNQMNRFRKLGPMMNLIPDQIEESIWPVWKVWCW